MNQLFTQFIIQQTAENTYSVDFSLNPEHVIFQAHFPGQPILPGITMLRVIRDIAAQIVGKNIRLQSIKNVKFTNVVTPREVLDMQAKITLLKDNNHYKVSGTLHHNHAIAAKLEELVYAS